MSAELDGLRAAWADMMAALDRARDAVDSPDLHAPPVTSLGVAEGYRYLMGFAFSAIERAFAEDPEFPYFRRAIQPIDKATIDKCKALKLGRIYPTPDYTPFATLIKDAGANWTYCWAPWVTQVRTLEGLRRLFHRGARLTRAGQLLLPHAQRLLALADARRRCTQAVLAGGLGSGGGAHGGHHGRGGGG